MERRRRRLYIGPPCALAGGQNTFLFTPPPEPGAPSHCPCRLPASRLRVFVRVLLSTDASSLLHRTSTSTSADSKLGVVESELCRRSVRREWGSRSNFASSESNPTVHRGSNRDIIIRGRQSISYPIVIREHTRIGDESTPSGSESQVKGVRVLSI